jgi:hypothetical protein
MSDNNSQLQKTGYGALNAKNGGSGTVLLLKEISLLSAIFAKRILVGDALRPLRSKGM